MYQKGSKQGTVRFVLKPGESAKKVVLVGDFSKWQPILMRKQNDGSFTANVPLAAGTYEYKFIVDGEWVVDPENNTWALNPYGTLNSVAHVE